jgi:hypothetical protein
MEILLAISVILLLAMAYICGNMYRKIKTYELTVEYYEAFYTKFAEGLVFVDAKLKELDKREIFSSDDEIGFAYTAIKRFWKMLIDMGLQLQPGVEERQPTTQPTITAKDLVNLPSVKTQQIMPTSDTHNLPPGRRVL